VKTALKVGLSLCLAALFLWAAFRGVDLDHLWQAMGRLRLPWLAALVALFLLSNLPRARRWQVLMAPVSREIPFWSAVWALMVGYAGNCLIPRAGELARVMAIRQTRKLPVSGLVATVVVERVLDMLTVVLLLGVVLLFYRDQIALTFPWMEAVGIAAFAACLLVLLALGLLSAKGDRALAALKMRLSGLSPSLAARLTDALGALFRGMGAVRTASGYLEITIHTALLNAAYLSTVYVALLGFGFTDRYDLGLSEALVVLVISTVGVIIPTPGGTGTYHYFCSQTLHHFYRVPLADALAFATVVHGVGYIAFLVVGGPGLFSLIARHRFKPSDQASEG
jgi:glycosyltransferase 2 family protein